MKKELKVATYSNAKTLVEVANKNADNIEIVSISTSQYGSTTHYIWYYEKE